MRLLEDRATHGYVPASALAAVHLARGDRAGALGLLEQAEGERDIRMAFVGIDARWNPLRDEPRFRALARRLGLGAGPAYGRY